MTTEQTHNLIKANFLGNKRRRGVCMSYKDHFTVKWRDDLCTLQECLVTEIESGGKSCFFTCLSRYLSQTHDQLEDFYKLMFCYPVSMA